MKVFFLNPTDKSSQTRVLTEILSVINESSGTLRIAIAYFTHPEIAKALIQRIQLGREAKLIINASDILRPSQPNETEIVISKNLLEVLRQNIVPRTLGNRSTSEYQNMHHKFMVSESKVIFGSLNWTTAALNNNFECVAVSSEPEAITLFTSEFEKIWKQAEELYVVSGKVRMIMCPICKSMDGVDFESWGPFCLYCGHKFKVV
jgi:phosphatidylserine/phosphatidylglycerophosphate/cardiolipin synthase-like enzyme